MKISHSLFRTVAVLAVSLASLAHGQTAIVTSSTAPATGANDIVNFNDSGSPNGNQDYSNNLPPGQTFTTLGTTEEYDLDSVTVQGGNSAGFSAGQPLTLTIYSIAGTTLTSLGSQEFAFSSPLTPDYASDYLTLNLTTPIALAANTQYAFTLGNSPDGTGHLTNPSAYYGFAVSAGDVYDGGAAFQAAIPASDGGDSTIASGPYGYDRSFAIGLVTVPEPSMWALMLAGVAMLFGFLRFRCRTV
jgi:hypothetical protein